MPRSRRLRLRAQRYSRAATGQRRARCLQGRKVSELTGTGQAGGRLPLPRARSEDAPAHLNVDQPRTRNFKAAGGRQFGERDCRAAGAQRKDGGSPQIQPHAQTRHSQQGATGNLRDPEKDHQDSRQPITEFVKQEVRSMKYEVKKLNFMLHTSHFSLLTSHFSLLTSYFS